MDKTVPMAEPGGVIEFPPGTRGDLYRRIAALYQPPTWERVSGTLDRLLLKHPGFLVGGNPKVNIAKELDLLEKESYRHGLEVFQQEYVRLFVNAPGGVAAPPHASFYSEGCVLGKAALEATSYYERFRIRPETTDAEPPDHIVFEMEFLSFLCLMEQKAAEAGRAEDVSEVGNAQAAFFERHFFPWTNRFCDRLFQTSRLAFYQILGIFTRGFLLNERRVLGRKGLPKDG